MNKDLQEALEQIEVIDGRLGSLTNEVMTELSKNPENEFLAYIASNLMNERKQLLDLGVQFGPKADPSMKDYYANRAYNQKGVMYEMENAINKMQNPELTQEKESPNRAAFK